MSRTYARSLVMALVLACGCSSDDTPADAGTVGLVVYAQAFYGFHDWSSVPAVGPAGMVDAVHTTQPLTAYINHVPPHGSASFPLGTIIVKEVSAGDPTTRQIFAMVKRGGDFNSAGAVDWEWFELQNTTNPALPVTILWRGFGPIGSTDSYGGNPNTCNDCHEGAQANDYVWTQALQLSSF